MGSFTGLSFLFSFSGVEEPVHTIVIWSLACREARNQKQNVSILNIYILNAHFPLALPQVWRSSSSSKRTSARQTDRHTTLFWKTFRPTKLLYQLQSARRPQHSRFSLLFPSLSPLIFIYFFCFNRPVRTTMLTGPDSVHGLSRLHNHTEKKGGCTHSPRKKRKKTV